MLADESALRAASALPDPDLRPDFYAGVLAKRLMAWLVDVTIVAVACLLLLPFTAFLGLLVFPLMMLVVGFFYRWSTLSGGSATWGMRMMGVQLREADGLPLSNTTALMHTAAYSVCVGMAVLQLVSIGLMLISPRRQGLPDHLLGTAMINRPI